MGGKRRKLALKQQANGKPARAASNSRGAFIPKRHSDMPLSAAGPSSGNALQNKKLKKKSKEQQQRQIQRNLENPTIPFDADERILLIGEGDLSFAASIIRHHRCRHVTATVLEKDHAELVAKYPAAEVNIAIINGAKPPKEKPAATDNDGDDANGADNEDGEKTKDNNGEENAVPSPTAEENDSDSDADYDADGNYRPRGPKTNRVLYNIDATKLPPALTTKLPATGLFHRILFNFPHVGGKSTDVNRQVRYNQELLVSFFQRAAPALAPGGTIIVTLFEGEPYTLWNVRDLARHVGLQVDSSFRFHAAAYPGYQHARTLGVIRSKKGSGGAGGWKGEDRMSRSHVFVRKGDVVKQTTNSQKKKRKRDSSDDEDDSSEDELD